MSKRSSSTSAALPAEQRKRRTDRMWQLAEQLRGSDSELVRERMTDVHTHATKPMHGLSAPDVSQVTKPRRQ
jgi:hypothetical protein